MLCLRAPITIAPPASLRTSTMSTTQAVSFSDVNLNRELDLFSNEDLDGLDFGVIGIDAAGVVQRYNSFESKAAGLSSQRVLGQPLFTVVAPCMNNFMVAQRFEDALAGGSPLDAVIDYVLTLRMRPVKVKLRLLAAPEGATRYVLVQRPA
jgi:photoactive yellow protein